MKEIENCRMYDIASISGPGNGDSEILISVVEVKKLCERLEDRVGKDIVDLNNVYIRIDTGRIDPMVIEKVKL